MGIKLLYAVSVFLIFENTSLSKYAGVFTSSLAMLLLPLVISYLMMGSKKLGEIEKKLCYIFFVFFIYSLILLVLNYYDNLRIDFLVDRGLRFALLALPTMLFFIFFCSFTEKSLEKALLVFSLSILIIYIFNLLLPNIFNVTSFFQGSYAHSPHRMRGFTLEASTFGFQVGIAGIFLARYFALNRLLSFVIICIAIFLTTSKGGLITFSLAFFIAILLHKKTVQSTKTLLLFSFLALSPILYLEVLLPAFATDIEKYNSSATRSTMILVSIFSLFEHPFGVGFFGYLPSIYENGKEVIQSIEMLMPNVFDYKEVTTYLYFGAVKGVSTKSFIFDWLIYFGVIFLYYLYNVVKWYISKLKEFDFYFLVVFLFILMSVTFYLPIDGRFIVPLVLAFLYKSVIGRVNKYEK